MYLMPRIRSLAPVGRILSKHASYSLPACACTFPQGRFVTVGKASYTVTQDTRTFLDTNFHIKTRRYLTVRSDTSVFPPTTNANAKPQLIDFDDHGEKTLLRRLFGYYSAHQVRMRKVNHIYNAMEKRTHDPFFLRLYNTEQLNFQQWFGVAVFHFWIVSVGLRQIGTKESEKQLKELFQVFWVDAETKMFEWGLKDLPGRALILGKQQKHFLKQYLGCMSAYDEGLVYGDPTMAEAVWRDLLYMEPSSAKELYFFVQYARQQLSSMAAEKELLARNAHISWLPLPQSRVH